MYICPATGMVTRVDTIYSADGSTAQGVDKASEITGENPCGSLWFGLVFYLFVVFWFFCFIWAVINGCVRHHRQKDAVVNIPALTSGQSDREKEKFLLFLWLKKSNAFPTDSLLLSFKTYLEQSFQCPILPWIFYVNRDTSLQPECTKATHKFSHTAYLEKHSTIYSLLCMSPAPSISESSLGIWLSDNKSASAAMIHSQEECLVHT